MKDYAYKLLYLSVILFAIFTTTSIAADSFAISIGIIGLLLLIASRQFIFKKSDIAPGLFSINYFWSSLFSLNPLHSLANFHYIWHFAPYWITSRLKVNTEKIIKVLAIFTLISAFGVFFNAFSCVKPADVFSVGLSAIHFSIPSKACAPEGFSGFPSYIGAIMLISTFFFGSLGVFKKNKLYLAVAIATFLATILTQERQDWIALLAGILFVPFFVKDKRIWLLYLIGAIAVVGLSQAHFVKNRLYYTIHYTKDPDIVIRFAMIKASFDIFEHSSFTRKLTGYGPSYASKLVHDDTVRIYKQMASKYHIDKNTQIATVIDNYYINILMSCGVVGLALILTAFAMLLINNIKRIKYAQEKQKAALIGITLGLIAFYVASGFDNLLGSAQVSIYLSFMIGLVEMAASSVQN